MAERKSKQAAKLDPYRAKRRSGRTPEPLPGSEDRSAHPPSPETAGDSFVIQEHHASALHWDFRLERDGVLVSWALPKGLPPDPAKNHLAVPTEDHPLEYASFSGRIPVGEYGGGEVTIWDSGHYECEKWSEREVMVVLHGRRASGRYVLFRTGGARAGAGKDPWMIHRMDPPPADWVGLPELVRPMLARTGELPVDDAGWAYEFKWDGVRAVVYVEGGRLRLVSRNDHDVTTSYPELRGLGVQLGTRQAVLDGEIVALDEQGNPSFGVLQQRMHVADAGRARRLADRVPATYLAFDVLHLDGRTTVDLPYDERRRLLEGLGLEGSSWAVPPSITDASGAQVLQAAQDRALEGVVAKRRDSTYQPGRRTGAWIKVKNFKTQEVVLGGWTPGRGRRAGEVGALLMGLPADGSLVYVGKVGTGFTDEILTDLGARLGRLRRPSSPFTGRLPPAQVAGATWVEPSLVGEVRFTEWTGEGRLRHPSWRGLRPTPPGEVAREP